MKTVNEIGNRYGRLTVLSREGSSKKGYATWLCQCDCGEQVVVEGRLLRSGTTCSCGCLARDSSGLVDETGNRYGRLVVIRRDDNNSRKNATWLCLCDCGNTTVVSGYDLRHGNKRSCGCLLQEHRKSFSKRHGKHGTRLYLVWKSMKTRCYNKNHPRYKDYGGRGIIVCDEWVNDYLAFHNWAMWNGYDENAKHGDCTLDRIDNNGIYSPSNCRFVDMKTQRRNQRRCKKNSVEGEKVDA